MAFDAAVSKVPQEIGKLLIILEDDEDDEGNPIQAARYKLVVEYSDGSVERRAGDLVPHITPTQRQGLLALMDSVRATAEAEILPAP